MGNEFIHIIAEYGSPADPLPVDFTPSEFRPTRIRYGHVKLVLLNTPPVFRGYDMTQGMVKSCITILGMPVVPDVKYISIKSWLCVR